MHLSIFAHNGIEHSTQAEASAHGASSTMWIVLISIIVLAGMVTIFRILTKSVPSKASEPTKKETK